MAAYISFQPSDYFTSQIYTGDGGSQALTGFGFQPDLSMLKNRTDGSTSLPAVNSVVGNTKYNYTDSAATLGTITYLDFDSDGITVENTAISNASGKNYASWHWLGGTTTGIATNGSTTITPSAYSFNQTSGTSILQYTGTGVSGEKVAHGLGAVPQLIITKNHDAADAWSVFNEVYGSTKAIELNNSAGLLTASGYWNDTDPDSVNFTVGNSGGVNGNTYDYTAYCFAEKKGFSKFGKYIGNDNANGTFVYTGFRPSMLVIKLSTGDGWFIYDTKRMTYNYERKTVKFNDPYQEQTGTTNENLDILSNGFKLRYNTGGTNDAADYMFWAFAEFPLVSSNDVPGLAR